MRESDENAARGSQDETDRGGSAAIAVGHDREGTTVRVQGELDLESAPALERALSQLAAGGRLLIDLDAVEFMDSSGLAVLLRARQAAQQNGHRLAVRFAGSPTIARLFELTGTSDHFGHE